MERNKTNQRKSALLKEVEIYRSIYLEEYFGIITKQCVSLKGDKFTLEKGMKVLIRKIYKERG